MKRRSFLKTIAPVVVMPSLINGLTVKAYANANITNQLAGIQVDTNKVIVLIQLNGGNDGLNTVLNLDQYDNLAAARGDILIPESAALALTGTTDVALHPAMTGMQQLYNEGKVTIVQGVSYPNPNYSHFRATDIIASAADAEQMLTTGWCGRYLEQEYPNFPTDYPNTNFPDPPAIQIGVGLPLLFQGTAANLAVTLSGTQIFDDWINGSVGTLPETPAGHELGYLRTVSQQTQSYAGQITTAALNITSQSPNYPAAGTNSLADQLKLVARLIAGGLQTRIYLVSLGGFDTHATQVVAGNTATGNHATLLGNLSQAIKAFMDDLTYLNIQERVVGLTFSEFGRRIISNGSGGTDHGAAYPMFVFGEQVASGIVGNSPVIPATTDENDNLAMQFDFRTIYASLLKDWFCADQAMVDVALADTFLPTTVVEAACCVAPTPVITASSAACVNGITTYSVPAVAGNTYLWIVSGGTIVSGQGTNSIQVQWSNGTIGEVHVQQGQ
jgi:uncharacterized protein (DUF1501 family)